MLLSFSDHINCLDLYSGERKSISVRKEKNSSVTLMVVGVSVLLAVDGIVCGARSIIRSDRCSFRHYLSFMSLCCSRCIRLLSSQEALSVVVQASTVLHDTCSGMHSPEKPSNQRLLRSAPMTALAGVKNHHARFIVSVDMMSCASQLCKWSRAASMLWQLVRQRTALRSSEVNASSGEPERPGGSSRAALIWPLESPAAQVMSSP